jgi:transcriptional regulator with XRE-family HTH domain
MKHAVAQAFGVVLRSARESAGLSQHTLAIRADIDRTYPSLLERGLRSPTLDTLINLAPVLGVAAQALVKRTEVQLRRLQSRRAKRRGARHAAGRYRRPKRTLSRRRKQRR